MTNVVEAAGSAEALAERITTDAVAAFELFSVYVGDALGLYRALAERGAVTSTELAEAAGVNERYAREWLEGQAAAGLLAAEEGEDVRRFRLPPGHEETLLDATSLNYAAPTARAIVASIRPIDALLGAIRNGGGIPYADYGDDLHEAQAAFTRPMFERLLGSEWLPAVPAVHRRLSSDPPARVADIACGQGRSSIEIARAYPKAVVEGIDSDHASIERAHEHLASSGLDGRVSFHARNAARGLTGPYELITIFEALHDMSYPVAVLQAAREALSEHGVVLIGDERTEDEFTAPAGEVERLYYGFSLFHCLPVGMVGEGAAGTGTVIRQSTIRSYAAEAGFSSCEVLPIENDFWRFYLLRP